MSLPPDHYRVPRARSKLSPHRIGHGLTRRLRRIVFRNDPKIRRSVAGLTRGLRLRMDLRLHSLVLFGLYEVELAPHIRALYPRGSTAYDVGAHDGYYALILAKRGRNRVLAIEPEPDARAALEAVLRENPSLGPLVQVVPEIVGGPNRDSTTLDDLAWREDSFVPDLVKIDAEGAEAEILRGSVRLMRERHPHFVIETHSLALENECIELLEAASYSPVVVDQRRWLRESRPLVHNRWLVARGHDPAASA